MIRMQKKEICQTDIGQIKTLLLKHARDAFSSEKQILAEWGNLNYSEKINLSYAIKEYETFIELFFSIGVNIRFLPKNESTTLDSIYVRDASIATDRGMILCNMGKAARRTEPGAQAAFYKSVGIPILGEINGDGCLEGGDVAWLDARTLAVGRGYRTNDEGIRQLRDLLRDSIDELITVPLPHFRGPDDVFHLMSIFSPVDHDLAVVYSPLMPVTFRETLQARGFRLVEVPESEYESMGCNVLALAPGKCLMLSGNPITQRRLEKAGAEVMTYDGKEISLKGCGGPTCLTRPLLRLL